MKLDRIKKSFFYLDMLVKLHHYSHADFHIF